MIGAGYERRLTRRNISQKKSSLMITVLGSILTLERSVLEQRLFVEKCYEQIQNGTPEVLEFVNRPELPVAAEFVKRKRDDEEVVYVAASSEESDEETMHHSKRKRTEKSPKKSHTKGKAPTQAKKSPNGKTYEEVEFAEYQKQRIRNEDFVEEDGLRYSPKLTGDKFAGFQRTPSSSSGGYGNGKRRR
jgi:hypothetical protein